MKRKIDFNMGERSSKESEDEVLEPKVKRLKNDTTVDESTQIRSVTSRFSHTLRIVDYDIDMSEEDDIAPVPLSELMQRNFSNSAEKDLQNVYKDNSSSSPDPVCVINSGDHLMPESDVPSCNFGPGIQKGADDAGRLADIMTHYCRCRKSIHEFTRLRNLGEGAFGVVYKARNNATGEIVAVKRQKLPIDDYGFPLTALREVAVLRKTNHQNIVNLTDVVLSENECTMYLVMEYVDHDLYKLIRDMIDPFLLVEVKWLLKQLLMGLAHLHDNFLIHRDLKTSNILVTRNGILKIADFGSSRGISDPPKSYTPGPVTLWYRAPELLMGTQTYGAKIDMWSAGCVFGELLIKKVFFPGESEINQLHKTVRVLGNPNPKIWPDVVNLPGWNMYLLPKYPYNRIRQRRYQTHPTELGFQLLTRLLTYDPSKRLSAADALKHPFFSAFPSSLNPDVPTPWRTKFKISM